MTKEEYLHNAFTRINELENDLRFRSSVSQIRARAIQEETSPGSPPDVRYKFRADEVWKYCDYIFSEGSLLIREGTQDKSTVLLWIKHAAEAFEFLARFAAENDASILLVNAAICYHIAGYQANAQCLAKVVGQKFPTEVPSEVGETAPDIVLANLFRASLLSFLRRDISRLRQNTDLFRSFSDELQTLITTGLTEAKYSQDEVYSLTAHAYFQHSLISFTNYCLRGEKSALELAFQQMEKSHTYFQHANDTTFSTLTSELRTVLELFGTRSTQSTIERVAPELLQDRIWRLYLLNLALDKSIVEFWQSQLKAIDSGILSIKDSFVVQMPTSAGKTLIAELTILAEITRNAGSRCLYIAPYRALVNEIQRNLSTTLGTLGFRVSNLIGGFEFDAFQDFLGTEADVLIATPEKVDLFLRTHPEYFTNLKVVVVDEGHVLGEGLSSLGEDEDLKELLGKRGTLGRGAQLENLLERLKRKLPETRFLFLSAVMPDVNANDFVEWLSKTKKEPLRIDRNERPSRQLISRFHWVNANNGELEYLSLPAFPDGKHPFVARFIRREQYYTGEYTLTGLPQRKSWPDLANKSQTTAVLATQFANSGPVLVFCAMPGRAKLVAENVLTHIKHLVASERSFTKALAYIQDPDTESFLLAKEWLGEDHVLTKALRNGVGLHYGGLPDVVREAVENDFRTNKIAIIISTNTLAQGVNLPIKTAIINELLRIFPDSTPTEPDRVRIQHVSKRDFWNICGRAGRAGKETEGQVVFVTITENDRALLREYQDDTNLEEIVSPLYQILKSLTEKRIEQEYLIGYLDTVLLSLMVEEIVDTNDEKALYEYLNTSLVGIQSRRNSIDIAPLVSAFQNVATWLATEVPTELRPVFSSTGLRVSSCQILEREIDLFLRSVDENVLRFEHELDVFNDALLQSAFLACRDLPEMRLKIAVSYGGPEDEYELVKAWVKGMSVSDLRNTLWLAADADDLSEYISDRFGYKLPWGINAFLRILAYKLGKEFTDLPPSWQSLPSMLKFGVDSIISTWAANLGISRILSLQLPAKYPFQAASTFVDFLRWVIDLPFEFVLHDLVANRFDKQHLISIRNRINPNRDNLDLLRDTSPVILSKVQGTQYNNRQFAALKAKPGDAVELHQETSNQFDPFAIRVSLANETIGYMQSSKAQIVSPLMRVRSQIQAFIVSVNIENPIVPEIEMSIQFDLP